MTIAQIGHQTGAPTLPAHHLNNPKPVSVYLPVRASVQQPQTHRRCRSPPIHPFPPHTSPSRAPMWRLCTVTSQQAPRSSANPLSTSCHLSFTVTASDERAWLPQPRRCPSHKTCFGRRAWMGVLAGAVWRKRRMPAELRVGCRALLGAGERSGVPRVLARVRFLEVFLS